MNVRTFSFELIELLELLESIELLELLELLESIESINYSSQRSIAQCNSIRDTVDKKHRTRIWL
jgi:hypothetical protein